MEAYALTDTGRVRNMNQDYIYSSPERVGTLPNLFLVADGMGGHRAGDYASRYTVENLVVYLHGQTQGSPVMQLKTGIREVNERLYEESRRREELKGMGCTLVAAVAEADTLYVANVGDSRLYVLHDGQLRQITLDHSLVEEMVRTGSMSQEMAYHHPKKHMITRAVGAEDKVDIDFFDVSLFGDEIILLCSDGLSNMVEDDRIRELLLTEESAQQRAESLVQAANQKGGRDNITVIVVEPFSSEVKAC